MKCSKCRHYSRRNMRCSLGHINPLKVQAKSVKSIVSLMGRAYLCAVDEECAKRRAYLYEKYLDTPGKLGL